MVDSRKLLYYCVQIESSKSEEYVTDNGKKGAQPFMNNLGK